RATARGEVVRRTGAGPRDGCPAAVAHEVRHGGGSAPRRARGQPRAADLRRARLAPRDVQRAQLPERGTRRAAARGRPSDSRIAAVIDWRTVVTPSQGSTGSAASLSGTVRTGKSAGRGVPSGPGPPSRTATRAAGRHPA